MRLQVRISVVAAAVFAGAHLSPFSVTSSQAGLVGLGEPRVGYTFHYFSDVEGVTVHTHYITGGVNMARNVTLSAQYAHDIVVFPAVDATPGSQEAVDAITTASRPIASNADPYEDFVKERDEFQATATFRGLVTSYYVSTESDYFAQMVSAGYSHGFLRDNLTLAGGASYSRDNIQPLEDADTDANPDYRNTWHANLVVTQILTPTTVVRVGAEYNRVRGLQHVPYRNVYVAGTNVPERHPKYRDRRDAFVHVSQYVTNRSSIKVDYRYYEDDWGVASHTIGGKLSQYVTDNVVVRYRYRYYSQIPAFFFRDDYAAAGGVDGFQTNDYRLGDYGAHLFGGRIMWFPHGALGNVRFLRDVHFVIGYEHYFNSNNFTANIVETGMRISF